MDRTRLQAELLKVKIKTAGAVLILINMSLRRLCGRACILKRRPAAGPSPGSSIFERVGCEAKARPRRQLLQGGTPGSARSGQPADFHGDGRCNAPEGWSPPVLWSHDTQPVTGEGVQPQRRAATREHRDVTNDTTMNEPITDLFFT